MSATAATKKQVTTKQATTTAKKETTKKVSDYQKNVLFVNRDFKTYLRNTGKAIKLLLSTEAITPKQKMFFRNLQKNDVLYQAFDKTVKRNKNNEVSVFEVLKAYHRTTK
jgi:hypothetical protein